MLRFKYRYIFIFTLLLILLINIFIKNGHNCLSFLPYGISESSYVTLASEKSFCVGSKDIIKFQTNDKGARILKNKNFIKNLQSKNPLNTIGKPKDLITSILFLCSNSSNFITGINIPVDGGWKIW